MWKVKPNKTKTKTKKHQPTPPKKNTPPPKRGLRVSSLCFVANYSECRLPACVSPSSDGALRRAPSAPRPSLPAAVGPALRGRGLRGCARRGVGAAVGGAPGRGLHDAPRGERRWGGLGTGRAAPGLGRAGLPEVPPPLPGAGKGPGCGAERREAGGRSVAFTLDMKGDQTIQSIMYS